MAETFEEDRRSGEDRRHHRRRADDWRDHIRRLLQYAGVITIAYTGIGWVFGPVLGKRVVGPDDAVRSVQVSDSAQWKSINQNTRALEGQQAVSKSLLFMVCPMYSKSFPGAPVPDECPRRGQ